MTPPSDFQIIVRPAVRADLPACYRLARTKELRAPSHQGAERWWIRAFISAQQPFFVAVHRDQIVGFTLGECATGKVAIRHLTAAAPNYRRRGLGRRLVRAFERECRARGQTCVLAYVSGGQGWERALRRLGYARGSLVREYQKFL